MHKVLKPFWWRVFPSFNSRENITIGGLWSRVLITDHRFKAASWTKENKRGNAQYYLEVEFNFRNDWYGHGCKMIAKVFGKNSVLLFEELIWRINLSMVSFSEARLWNLEHFLAVIGILNFRSSFFPLVACILGLNLTVFLNAGFLLINLRRPPRFVCLLYSATKELLKKELREH